MYACICPLMQTEREDVPVLLVGGGSVLVDCENPLKGASKVIVPSGHWVSVHKELYYFLQIPVIQQIRI